MSTQASEQRTRHKTGRRRMLLKTGRRKIARTMRRRLRTRDGLPVAVVSCADTLALAARDSVRLLRATKGPFIPLPTGRRDGNRSVAADVALFSPAPDANITDIINLFAIRFNLTAKDVAVLSGAHTIGQARCCTVSPRLYDFAGHKDGSYTATLRGQCKLGDNATLVDLDTPTPTTFDADYYALDVLTHHKGEIRKVCSKVNPPSPPLDSPPVVVPYPPSSADAAPARSYQLAAATGGLALAVAAALVL